MINAWWWLSIAEAQDCKCKQEEGLEYDEQQQLEDVAAIVPQSAELFVVTAILKP